MALTIGETHEFELEPDITFTTQAETKSLAIYKLVEFINTQGLNIHNYTYWKTTSIYQETYRMNFDYTEFDSEILSNIANKKRTNIELVRSSSAPYNTNTLGGRYRAVDRRLQSLRKNGHIKYSKDFGWELV